MALYERVLAGRTAAFGPKAQGTLWALNNMSLVHQILGDLDQAEAFCRRCYEGRLETLGAEHADTMISINNLSFLVPAEEGLVLLRTAAETLRASPKAGPKHPDTLLLTCNLGRKMLEWCWRQVLAPTDNAPPAPPKAAPPPSISRAPTGPPPPKAALAPAAAPAEAPTPDLVLTLAEAETLFNYYAQAKAELLGTDNEWSRDARDKAHECRTLLKHARVDVLLCDGGGGGGGQRLAVAPALWSPASELDPRATWRVALAEPFAADRDLTNAGALEGAVVLVQRGGCPFSDKVDRAVAAGAVAVVVANNDVSNPDALLMMGGPTGHRATVPVLMVSHSNGERIRALGHPALQFAVRKFAYPP